MAATGQLHTRKIYFTEFVMHVLIAVVSAIIAAGFWMYRIRAAKDAASEMFEMANDVRLAAKRFAYKRNHKTHPIDGVDDARLAAAGIMAIAAEMDGAITKAELDVMKDQAVTVFNCTDADADEFIIFGRWLASQGNNRSETTRRLIKRVLSLSGIEAMQDMIDMVKSVGMADGGPLDDGIEDIILRLDAAQKTRR